MTIVNPRLGITTRKYILYFTYVPIFFLSQEICSEIGHQEALVSQYHSLHHKLCPDSNDSATQQFLADLVMNSTAIMQVPEGPHGNVGKRITQMFNEAQKVKGKLCELNNFSLVIETLVMESKNVLRNIPCTTECIFIISLNS